MFKGLTNGVEMKWCLTQRRYLLLACLTFGAAGCSGSVTPEESIDNSNAPGGGIGISPTNGGNDPINGSATGDIAGSNGSGGGTTTGADGTAIPGSNTTSSNGVTPNSPTASSSNSDTSGTSGTTPSTVTSTEDPGATNPSFTCDASQVPDTLPLRRLSQVQYRNTLQDLVGYVAPNNQAAVMAEVDDLLNNMQGDLRQGPDTKFAKLTRLDQSMQQQRVDDYYAVGEALAHSLTSTSARLQELVGSCATATNVDTANMCMDTFITKFGEYAQRRPLAAEDVDFYRRVSGDAPFDAEDYSNVATVLLASPYMVYLVEHGVDGQSGSRVPLSGYELASRLSYQFWQTMPDAALFDAAASGALETDAGYEAQLDRVLADPRAERGMSEFIFEWLENPFLEQLDERVDSPDYSALLNGFQPTAQLKQSMQQEVVDSALYTLRTNGSYTDFFTSQQSFAKTEDLAAIYNVPVWSGGEPPTFSETERTGLLTRAALLATGLVESRPIIKGVLIRKAILCDDIPAPPANLGADASAELVNPSTREKVEARTDSGSCAGCHVGLINDLGFSTENFDSLGRVRTEQELYADDGAVLATVGVDTVGVPRVELDDTTIAQGVADVTRLILESDKPYACFARQYFRFTFGRMEHSERDGCVLAAMKERLQADASLTDVLKTIALDPSFRERTL